MTEAEQIDDSIEYLEMKLETLKKVKKQILKLEKGGAEVKVLNPRDSKHITVIVKTEKFTEILKNLAEFDQRLNKKYGRDTDVTYDYDDDKFRLEKKFIIE